MIQSFGKSKPIIHSDAFIAPTAVIIGDVTIGEGSSVWYNAVIRGDENPVIIGKRSNIQDLCMCHETGSIGPLVVGDDVTVGHNAILHGCKIGNRCLIGMGAVILDNAEIGDECIIAAGAVVLEGAKIEPRSLVAGMPAKVRRKLTEKDLEKVDYSSSHYLEHCDLHKNHVGEQKPE